MVVKSAELCSTDGVAPLYMVSPCCSESPLPCRGPGGARGWPGWAETGLSPLAAGAGCVRSAAGCARCQNKSQTCLGRQERCGCCSRGNEEPFYHPGLA